MDDKDYYWGNDLIFAKDVNGEYVFRGVFIRDRDKSAPKHHVSKRIATRVKLIGTPVYKIEPLNSLVINRQSIHLRNLMMCSKAIVA